MHLVGLRTKTILASNTSALAPSERSNANHARMLMSIEKHVRYAMPFSSNDSTFVYCKNSRLIS